MLRVAIPFDDGLITRLVYMLSDTVGKGEVLGWIGGFDDLKESRR